MWMGIEAWDHKKQAQKMSPVILSKAKDPLQSRLHALRWKGILRMFRAPTTNQNSKQRGQGAPFPQSSSIATRLGLDDSGAGRNRHYSSHPVTTRVPSAKEKGAAVRPPHLDARNS